jgi:hypothetical protein
MKSSSPENFAGQKGEKRRMSGRLCHQSLELEYPFFKMKNSKSNL